MKRVEVESFLKSFILFFVSLGFLISVLFYINYTKEISNLDSKLFSQMRVCSFDLKCTKFSIEFVENESQDFYILYKKENDFSGYFPILGANDFVMKLGFKYKDYTELVWALKKDMLSQYSIVLVIVLVLSMFFSFYTIRPLRDALLLTQEFIKDILHDFNTPLASLRLNTSMLRKDEINQGKILRIEQSVQNVLDLQENLKAYLYNHEMQREYFDIKELVQERVSLIEKNYNSIKFKVDMPSTHIKSNKEAMKRILDNLLSNAAKYNKKDGSVLVSYDAKNESLDIIDSGIGIKNPKRIFERFYKEGERGIGIGLHIVKKLCDELDINIKVRSELDKGTTFSLTLY